MSPVQLATPEVLPSLVWWVILVAVFWLMTKLSKKKEIEPKKLIMIAKEADRSARFNEELGRIGANQGGKAG